MAVNMICICGPTASGKTGLAVALAKRLDGEVVSCDSMQIYRGMDIGTAKPTLEEMQGIPHHLLDVASPSEDFSVSRYVELADKAVQDIFSRGKTVIVAGGTGLYMDSLIQGRAFAPFPETGKRAALEREAEQQGIEALLERLEQVDPEAAKRLHPSDKKRIIRALEVYEETGKTITQHNEETRLLPPKYRPVWLGLSFEPRQLLYDRIDLRVDQMIGQGLVEEVRRLLESGISPRATAMQAIGYKEIAAALRGECDLDTAVEQIKLGSRRYAKRQLTWFRRNPAIRWLVQPREDLVGLALATIRENEAALLMKE